MRSVVRSLVVVGLIHALVAGMAFGEEPLPQDNGFGWSNGAGIWEKAGRGVSNVTLGFLVEWPKTVIVETEARGPLFGLTVGMIKGIGLGVGRTLVGAYEVATFPLPNGSDFGPILEPATPFSTARTERFLDTPVR